jgi:hypothetical protein
VPKRATGLRVSGSRTWVRYVWLIHALYFLVTGIWPLIGRRSFQAVTGPKIDFWLVQTVGILTAVIGAVLAVAGHRQRVVPELAAVAAGASVGLTAIDVTYVARGRISRVYLVAALVQVLLCAGWVVAWCRRVVSRVK